MPEVVEVQIQTEGLNESIIGDEIVGVHVLDKGDKIIRPVSKFEFGHRLLDKTFLDVTRNGKYIVFKLSENVILTSHLAMTGRWLLNVPEEEIGHTRIKFLLKSGRVLRYSDVRVFGRIRIEEDLNAKIYNKGLDVLTASEEEIKNKLFLVVDKKPKLNVKELLTKQDILCGVGNVYANEILWETGIYPGAPLIELNDEEIELLAFTIKFVLEQGYKDGGLSFKDYYHVDGTKGSAQETLEVYKKTNCSICDSEIRKTDTFDGRATYYCPKCQK